jgi:transposase
MGKPYSMDLRERVVSAIEGGESTHQAAARFAIGIATAGVWARVARQSGWEHSDNQGGHFGGRGRRMIVAAQR